MPIKPYSAVTSRRRFQTTVVPDAITTNQPHKPLTEPKQRTGGRRNSGGITSWHRGGGHKRKLRLIDFKRDKFWVAAAGAAIEKQSKRSARIVLLKYSGGGKRFHLQPD